MPSTVNYNFTTPPLEGVKPDIPADLKTMADQIDAKIKELNDARIAAEAAIASPGTWKPFTTAGAGGTSIYSADWDDYGSTYEVPAYKVWRNRVFLKGLIRTAILRNAAVTVAQMPAEAIPTSGKQVILGACSTNASYVITSGAASAGTAHTHTVTVALPAVRVDIMTTGELRLTALSAALTIPVGGYFSVSGMSYSLD